MISTETESEVYLQGMHRQHTLQYITEGLLSCLTAAI